MFCECVAWMDSIITALATAWTTIYDTAWLCGTTWSFNGQYLNGRSRPSNIMNTHTSYIREDNDDIKLDIISPMDSYFGFPRFWKQDAFNTHINTHTFWVCERVRVCLLNGTSESVGCLLVLKAFPQFLTHDALTHIDCPSTNNVIFTCRQ